MFSDPRATQVYNNSIDDEEVSEVLDKMRKSCNVNAFFVLSNFIDCPEIKNEPSFFQMYLASNADSLSNTWKWCTNLSTGCLSPTTLSRRRKSKPTLTRIHINVESWWRKTSASMSRCTFSPVWANSISSLFSILFGNSFSMKGPSTQH